MNKLKIGLIALILTAATTTQAQFFQSVKKPTAGQLRMRSATGETQPLTKFEFRPAVNLASYVISEDVAQASIITGAGVGAQWLKWNTDTEKWNILVSVNALAYGRVALGNQSNGQKFMYGASVGLFDNLVMVGFATDSKNGYATMGVGIPLNNL